MSEIGEKLKEARTEKGYTLDDLQQITKIQKRYLLAIEEGNLEILPGNFYARAFIKQYADTVGLNGDQLLAEYTDFIPASQDKTYTEQVVTAKQTRVGSKQESIMDTIQEYLPTILVVVLVVVISGAIYFAMTQKNNEGGTMIQTNQDTSEIVVTSEQAQDDSANASSEDTTEEENEEEVESTQSIDLVSSTGANTTYAVTGSADEEHTLTLGAVDGDTWVSVTADGVGINQGLIQSGNEMEAVLPANTQSVVLVIGNSTVTTIELDGTEIAYAEEAKDIIRQKITFNFTQASE